MSKRGCSWFSAMVVAALLGAARTAHAQNAAAPALPVMLSRVGPAIVKVRRGGWWGTGFVFGSRHTIVTSYELVNGPGALQIVAADGVTHQARVRAWSPSDDLVVLEVEADVAPESLPPAHQPLAAGMDAVMLYEPRDPQLSPATSGGWTTPLPRFSHVSRVSAAELDLDLTVWGLLGDDGAVVLSNSGEVLGIISRRTTKQRRTIVTRVERIERLYQQLGKQGVFSATARGGWFSDLFLTPLYTTLPEKDRERTGFVGLGIDTGYRYDWLFASVSFGVFQSGQRRLSATVDEALTRYQPGLQAGAELKIIRNLDVFFGPGLTLSADDVETTSVAATGALENVESSRTRVRPLVVIGAVVGNFFARDVFTIAGTPEIQLDLGVAFGHRSSE